MVNSVMDRKMTEGRDSPPAVSVGRGFRGGITEAARRTGAKWRGKCGRGSAFSHTMCPQCWDPGASRRIAGPKVILHRSLYYWETRWSNSAQRTSTNFTFAAFPPTACCQHRCMGNPTTNGKAPLENTNREKLTCAN